MDLIKAEKKKTCFDELATVRNSMQALKYPYPYEGILATQRPEFNSTIQNC